jgi:uncharacterized RmlC-like cupin family protein
MRLPIYLLALSTALPAADALIDNESVRILKAVDEPHHKSAMHKHESNRVMIYLDSGDITLTYADGHQDKQHWKKNEVAWSPAAGPHTSENVGASPVRVIEIELKKPALSTPLRRDPKLDPIAIDPAHNILLFENPQVRVFRSRREPGGTEKMHEHTGVGRASIMLTGMDAKVKLQDGTTTEQHRSAGDASWSGPVTHATTNTGPTRAEMIIAEVK